MCLLFLSGTEPKYNYLQEWAALDSFAVSSVLRRPERATGGWRYLADKIYPWVAQCPSMILFFWLIASGTKRGNSRWIGMPHLIREVFRAHKHTSHVQTSPQTNFLNKADLSELWTFSCWLNSKHTHLVGPTVINRFRDRSLFSNGETSKHMEYLNQLPVTSYQYLLTWITTV
jgi:hypothetical protein